MKRKLYILLTVLSFYNIDFQRCKSAFTLSENNLNFKYVSSWIYLKVKRCQSGITIVYNYNNDNYVMTRSRTNVTSESTPSTLLTSYFIN